MENEEWNLDGHNPSFSLIWPLEWKIGRREYENIKKSIIVIERHTTEYFVSCELSNTTEQVSDRFSEGRQTIVSCDVQQAR